MTPEIEELVQQHAAAEEHLMYDRYVEALDGYRRIGVAAKKLGIASAFNIWSQAVALDYLRDYPAALHVIEKAIEMDPFSTNFRHSKNTIIIRMRRRVAELASFGDPDALGLYQVLVDAGHALPDDHGTIAGLHLKLGQLDQARRIAGALVVTNPTPDLYTLLGEICRAQGDEQGAVEADEQGAALKRRLAPRPELKVVN